MCGVWFDETTKKRKRTHGIISDLEEEENCNDDNPISSQRPRLFKRPKRTLKDSSTIHNKSSINHFKNLKVSKTPDLSISRIWTTSTGNFRTEARYLDVKDGRVCLRKSNGVTIAVPAHEMSLADLKLIEAFDELALTGMGVDLLQMEHWNPSLKAYKKTRKYPASTRAWTDRSGSFTVNAAFIALLDGKVRLHKENGVKIKVPIREISFRDLEFVEGCLNEKVAEEDRDALLEELRLS